MKMNLLYITNLHGEKWAGLTYSVPNQIYYQSKYDNVFWYNLHDSYKGRRIECIKCHSITEFPNLKIRNLPVPFNNPDLVIFEGFYHYSFYQISKECEKRKIPYIIVPRSSLTHLAQKSKFFKKKLGNLLFFIKFAKNACAIQYLTQQEYLDSTDKWNKKHLIISNGIAAKNCVKRSFNENEIKGIFIGRLDIYQKGLDLLIEACMKIKEELRENKCTIHIYGPDKNGSKSRLEDLVRSYGLQEIIFIRNGIYDEEKEKKLLESDFFILPSRFEGHPMALIEALSYGLPSLVTSGSNMADEIKEANAGWTCEISVDSIAEAFQKLLEEKNTLKQKGQNAYELSKKYSWEEIAKISHQEYNKLLKGDN